MTARGGAALVRAPSRPGGALARRLASFSLTVLVIVLPALAGARGLEQPVRASERASVRLALDDERGRSPVTLWWRIWLPAPLLAEAADRGADAIPDPDLDEVVPGVRLGNLLLLFVISGACFGAVALTRGRVAAAAACITLAFLPPIAIEGHFVRPEPVGLAFAALALVVLLGLPPHLRLRGSPVVVLGFGLTTATLIAFAIASTPFYGSYFWLPGGSLLGAAIPLTLRWGRPMARGRYLRPPPGHGFAKRLLPWLLPSLASLPLAFWALGSAGAVARAMHPAPAEVSALPASIVAASATVLLAAFGGAFLTLRVLHDMLRERRTTRAVVFAAFVVPLLVRGVRADAGFDMLPTALALAMVCGFGVAAGLWFVVPRIVRGMRPGVRPDGI
jgi:hypothetical protein